MAERRPNPGQHPNKSPSEKPDKSRAAPLLGGAAFALKPGYPSAGPKKGSGDRKAQPWRALKRGFFLLIT